MSAAPDFDPRRLDIVAFARAAGRLSDTWPQSAMPRLLQDGLPVPDGSPDPGVAWSARGECKSVGGTDDQWRLHLQARTTLQMACQRCLQPVTVPLDLRSTLRFVRGEQQAEALDEDSEEDVLALTKTLDLQSLVEDELILALPLVPRHERCPQPLPMSAGEAEIAADDGPGRAFEALAALRTDKDAKPS